MFTRLHGQVRGFGLGLAAALLAFAAPVGLSPASAAPARAAQTARLPIVFVHGNGDDAEVWITTIWRFESNGYPAALLDAVDFRDPLARAVEDKPQAGRSSAAEEMHELAAEVAAVRRRTGAAKVILIAQSRGGNIARDYVKNGGGAPFVADVILCGAVDHGVLVSDKILVGSEFNGASPFMRDLNSTPGEVIQGIRFLTIRSTNDDKYAQPTGKYFGLPQVETHVGYDGPALKGAKNVALPGLDHRETGFSPQAFAVMYKFITGHDPKTLDITPEKHPILSGQISGFLGHAPTNIGIAGARLAIYAVSPATGERQGPPLFHETTGAGGTWGPFAAEPDAYYEFMVTVPGEPVTHIYRSPFPRSSRIVDLRPQPFGKGDREAGAIVYMTRPRGYFGIGRDVILLNGKLPAGIPPGVPSVSSVHVDLPASPQRSVSGIFNQEGITALTWPTKDNQVSVIELTY